MKNNFKYRSIFFAFFSLFFCSYPGQVLSNKQLFKLLEDLVILEQIAKEPLTNEQKIEFKHQLRTATEKSTETSLINDLLNRIDQFIPGKIFIFNNDERLFIAFLPNLVDDKGKFTITYSKGLLLKASPHLNAGRPLLKNLALWLTASCKYHIRKFKYSPNKEQTEEDFSDIHYPHNDGD